MDDAGLAAMARLALPPLRLAGSAIHLHRSHGLRDRRGEVHAGSFLRERRIALNCTRTELPRIFVHELFHFAWLRLGNPVRRSWEREMAREFRAGELRDLGWSAEWRKRALMRADLARRTRKWREFCCESFCDTAAWLYSGVRSHPEFTLPSRERAPRRAWFRRELEGKTLAV